jgi:hypothetical protein
MIGNTPLILAKIIPGNKLAPGMGVFKSPWVVLVIRTGFSVALRTWLDKPREVQLDRGK